MFPEQMVNFGRKKKETSATRRTAKPLSDRMKALEQFVVEEIEIAGDAALATGGRVAKKRPRWLAAARLAAGWTGLWLLLVAGGLVSRSPWPVDETRLLGSAWEMWLRGDFLVPVLNGAALTHQPPLVLWLYLAGWKLFGVNAWWPRLVPALFGLGNMFLSGAMARFLWPGRTDVARYAPVVLLGSFFWAFYNTLALPDLALTFFVLLAVYALLWIWRKRDLRVWLLLAFAFGLGMLADGPMIFIYVLPPAVLAPLWTSGTPKPRWQYWYADLVKAALLGLVIFCGAWGIPVALQGGVQYLLDGLWIWPGRDGIAMFPPGQVWWWYLFLLPILALPWSMWPLVWMRLWHIRRAPVNAGMLFCLIWAACAILILSLFDLRQPQYLLPVVPAFSLAVSYLLLDEDLLEHAHDTIASSMAFSIILAGGLLAILPGLPRVGFLPGFLWRLSPFVGIAVVAVGVVLGWLPLAQIRQRVANVAAAAVVLTIFAELAVGWQFNSINKVDDVASELALAQDDHRPIAHVGTYEDEFQFAGRLTEPLDEINAGAVDMWLAAHPRGLLLTYTDAWQPAAGAALRLVFTHPYRDQAVRIWEAPEPAASGTTLPVP